MNRISMGLSFFEVENDQETLKPTMSTVGEIAGWLKVDPKILKKPLERLLARKIIRFTKDGKIFLNRRYHEWQGMRTTAYVKGD